jgi:hypothetical protein
MDIDNYDTLPEVELRDKIKAATEKGKIEEAQKLMKKLISMQKEAPKVEATDDELAEKGVDLILLQKERRLRDEIKQAQQDGEFLKAKELMRELRVTQKLQPVQTGVKFK